MSSSEENDEKPCHWYEDKWEWEKYEDKIVQQINDQSEMTEYDPKNGTNWCDLPKEMRMKCIEKMDLLSLYKLKNTSKTEESLVSCREEMNFEVVLLRFGCEVQGEFWENEDNDLDYKFYGDAGDISFKKALRDIAILLKMSTVDTLEIDYEGGFREMPDIFETLAPFKIRKIVSVSSRDPFIFKPHDFFIENCDPPVETLEVDSIWKMSQYFSTGIPKLVKVRMNFAIEREIERNMNVRKCPIVPQFFVGFAGLVELSGDWNRSTIPLFEFLQLGQCSRSASTQRNPKSTKIRFYKLSDGIIDYIKKWIQDDVEIGTELQCEILDGYDLNWLMKAFNSRKITSKHNLHRFRTDNPSKELTLSITHYQDKSLVKATWQMIPATTRKSTPMRAAKRKSSD